MSLRRTLASILVALAAMSAGGTHAAAQLSSRGTSLIIPITGVADLGGMFNGALLIERFTSEANVITAVGTVTGVLTANGTIRNLVMQVAVPLDLDASRARLNTDAALAQTSCKVLHVELGSASVPASTAASPGIAAPTRTATASRAGTITVPPSGTADRDRNSGVAWLAVVFGGSLPRHQQSRKCGAAA